MKMFITACSGFIGRHIAQSALAQGQEVSGIDIEDCPVDGVEFVKGDILDQKKVSEAIKGADVVIHLAAKPMTAFDKDLRKCYDVNVNGFMNVIEAAREEGCEKFTYASSSAVYENSDCFSEATVIDYRKLKSHYAKSKLMNEMVADSYSSKYGLKTIGFRFFNAYGPGDDPQKNIVNLFIENKRRHEKLKIYGDGKQARDFVYVDDITNIVLRLLNKGTYSIYNIGTGISTTYEEIANLIDEKSKVYVPNPLPSYLYLTRADTKRLFETLGTYKFVSLKEKIAELLKT
jgi:UDP-glucose 4-epimerase